ncbi:alpha/beta hydrolase-fold protein [Neptunicella marina]|uniref:Esterase n=1 Tax=Neptunicella marina TaxID=2125989 RepID=A0A8J6M5T0_9ALTE|nr:hypothetical protein [Neptunicella marina]
MDSLHNRPKDWQHSGGAPAFSRILKNQIIPFVENHYDIKDSSRTLIGKSMSGLAATYIALTQSDLFQQYLIISPSLWWDDWTYPRHQRAINQLATSSAAMAYSRSTRIYFAVGDDEERMGMVTDIYVLTNMLVKQQRPNL